MKLSLKLREEQHPLLRAKIPVSVLGLPFTSSILAGDPSDLSFSIQTNFASGPMLKLSYIPSAAADASPAAIASPFSISIRSGAGLFGSPVNSPLSISAHFSLLPVSHQPSFFLQFKPHLGDFSIKKTVSSQFYRNPNPNPSGELPSRNDRAGFVSLKNASHAPNLGSNEGFESHPTAPSAFESVAYGSHNPDTDERTIGPSANGGTRNFIPPGIPFVWKNLRMDSCCERGGLLSGFALRVRTVLPVMEGVNMNFRWGMNLSEEFGKKLPCLTVDKIGIERVNGVKESKAENIVGDVGEKELLKGMCFCLVRDLEALRKENGEVRQTLEKLGSAIPARDRGRERESIVKKGMPPSVEKVSEFEQWRGKKNGEGEKKPTARAGEVESELQRAIKSASP